MLFFFIIIGSLFAVPGIVLIYKSRKHHQKSFLGISLAVIGLIVALPIVIPYVLLGANTVRCGHLPVVASSFAAGFDYDAPGSKQYFNNINIFNNHYFCSTHQAEENGYHNKP